MNGHRKKEHEQIKMGVSERHIPHFTVEAATGLEPVNNGFADRCLSHLAMPPKTGAGERIRTVDVNLGKVALYH